MPEDNDEALRLEILKKDILSEMKDGNTELVREMESIRGDIKSLKTGQSYMWAALGFVIAVFGTVAAILTSAAGLI